MSTTSSAAAAGAAAAEVVAAAGVEMDTVMVGCGHGQLKSVKCEEAECPIRRHFSKAREGEWMVLQQPGGCGEACSCRKLLRYFDEEGRLAEDEENWSCRDEMTVCMICGERLHLCLFQDCGEYFVVDETAHFGCPNLEHHLEDLHGFRRADKQDVVDEELDDFQSTAEQWSQIKNLSFSNKFKEHAQPNSEGRITNLNIPNWIPADRSLALRGEYPNITRGVFVKGISAISSFVKSTQGLVGRAETKYLTEFSRRPSILYALELRIEEDEIQLDCIQRELMDAFGAKKIGEVRKDDCIVVYLFLNFQSVIALTERYLANGKFLEPVPVRVVSHSKHIIKQNVTEMILLVPLNQILVDIFMEFNLTSAEADISQTEFSWYSWNNLKSARSSSESQEKMSPFHDSDAMIQEKPMSQMSQIDDIEIVKELANAYASGDASLVISSMERLMNELPGSEIHRIRESGLGRLLLDILRKHHDNKEAVVAGFDVMSQLTANVGENQVLFFELDANNVIFEIFKIFPQDTEVAEAGFRVLKNLADHEENKILLAEPMSTVSELMAQFWEEPKVILSILRFLRALASEEQNTEKFLDIIHKIAEVMAVHIENPNIREEGCWTIWNLSTSKDFQSTLSNTEAVGAIVRAIKQNQDSLSESSECQGGIWTLCNLASEEENISRLIDQDALDAIIQSFNAHFGNTKISDLSVRVLALMSKDPRCAKSLSHHTTTLLIKAMTDRLDNGSVTQSGCELLANLFKFKSETELLGAREYLVEAMKKYQGNRAISEQVNLVLETWNATKANVSRAGSRELVRSKDMDSNDEKPPPSKRAKATSRNLLPELSRVPTLEDPKISSPQNDDHLFEALSVLTNSVAAHANAISNWGVMQSKLRLHFLLKKYHDEIQKHKENLMRSTRAVLGLPDDSNFEWESLENLSNGVRDAETRIGTKVSGMREELIKDASQRDDQRRELVGFAQRVKENLNSLIALYTKAKEVPKETGKNLHAINLLRAEIAERSGEGTTSLKRQRGEEEEEAIHVHSTSVNSEQDKFVAWNLNIREKVSALDQELLKFNEAAQRFITKSQGDSWIEQILREGVLTFQEIDGRLSILKKGTTEIFKFDLETQKKLLDRSERCRDLLHQLQTSLETKNEAKSRRECEALVRKIVRISYQHNPSNPDYFDSTIDDGDTEFDFPDFAIQAKNLIVQHLPPPIKLPDHIHHLVQTSRFFVPRDLERDYEDRNQIQSIGVQVIRGTLMGTSGKRVVLKALAISEDEIKTWLSLGRAFRHSSMLPLEAIFVDLDRRSQEQGVVLQTPDRLGGDLTDWLGKDRTRPMHRRIVVLLRISQVLSIMHENSLLHRDIKMENILLDSGKDWAVPCLCDLDNIAIDPFRTKFSKSRMRTHISTRGIIGTDFYIDPNLFANNGTPSVQSDLWSLAVVILVVLIYNGDSRKAPKEGVTGPRFDVKAGMEAFRERFKTGKAFTKLNALLTSIFRLEPSSFLSSFVSRFTGVASTPGASATSNSVRDMFMALQAFAIELGDTRCVECDKSVSFAQSVECDCEEFQKRHIFCIDHFNEKLMERMMSQPFICITKEDGAHASFSEYDITFRTTSATMNKIAGNSWISPDLKSRLELHSLIFPRCPNCDLLVENVNQAAGIFCPNCNTTFCGLHGIQCKCTAKGTNAKEGLLVLNANRRKAILGSVDHFSSNDPVIADWFEYFCIPAPAGSALDLASKQ